MEIKKIYLGAWGVGSNIHLKEFYQVVKTRKSENFSEKEISAWLKNFNIEDVVYNPQAFNNVKGHLKNGVEFEASEDGVMFVSSTVEGDIVKEKEKLNQIMKGGLEVLWNNISSRDVAMAEIKNLEKEKQEKEKLEIKYPFVIEVENLKEEDVESFFGLFNEVVYKKVDLEKGQVLISESQVVLNNLDMSDNDILESIRYLLFARLYELKLKNLLESQRKLWNKINGVRQRKYYKNQELPEVRDVALSVQNQSNFYKSFTKQIDQLLIWREKFINDYLKDHNLENLFKEFFISLHSTQKYLSELWDMTDDYASDTVQAISLLYSDNQQKELRTLQKLFLITAVVSILSLGTLSGSKMITKTPEGILHSEADILAWHWQSFIYYGGVSLLATLFIYYAVYLLFIKFKKPEKVPGEEKKKK